jgi:protein-disulfide isomerase
MKNWLVVVVCLLLVVDISIQGINLYQRHSATRSYVSSVEPDTTIDLTNHAIQGDLKARKVIVEFGDFECPFCLRFATEVLPTLRRDFVERGAIKYAYMNTPLPIHPNAKLLATAAICAGKQDHFWEMHDAFIEKKPSTRSGIIKIAESLNLSTLVFDACLTDRESENQINSDIRQAMNLGVKGAPSFAVGTLQPDGKVLVKTLIAGVQPVKVFERAIAE